MKKSILYYFAVAFLIVGPAFSQTGKQAENTIKASVDFSQKLQPWDGFGVNYVELAQSTNPITDPQEYGGFSLLTEEKRQEIINIIFGADGLQPDLIKMFFDPFQQKQPGGVFDHESTTHWMRYFVHEGIKKTKERGGNEIDIITTLYGPPGWATKQKFLRGRDLDPTQYENLAKYMINWTKYLVDKEKLPVKYLSLHNEGDSPGRWPLDGSNGNLGKGNDYNAFWRPWDVAHFLDFMPQMIKSAGLNVGLTPGECTTWSSFANYWYPWAILDNEQATKNIALITSHGFGEGDAINSKATDLLHLKRPDLHAWTTSMTWGNNKMPNDYDFVNLIRRNIYEAKVNAVIPWACIQTLTWVGGDPNPGTAFRINANGTWEIRPQYYFYKQLTRSGHKGMAVAAVETQKESGIELIAFASNSTKNPNSFIITNFSDSPKQVEITINGSQIKSFSHTRTSKNEMYASLGNLQASSGKLTYLAPAGTVTTFFEVK
jgi:O-glycosyl hydrolase